MSTLHNITKQIHFHPILLIFGCIAMLTGTFMQMLIIFIIIFWHEMGHYAAARFYKWRIRRVIFWVFGGVMETEEHGNQPLKEDVIVTVFGPLQHLIIYFFIAICMRFSLLPESILSIAVEYNTLILLFNLLPIYPLDGGKLCFHLLSYVYPYRKAHEIIIRFSLLACLSLLVLQLVFLPFTLSAFLLIGFIILENWHEWKNRAYVFIRFLLYRKTYSQAGKRIKNLYVAPSCTCFAVCKQFYRDAYHEIHLQEGRERIISEEACLKGYFHAYKHGEKLEK